MNIIQIANGILSVNSYFVINEQTREAVVIDCGENYDLIKGKENEFNVKIVAVLLTHAHFDHVGCAYRFIEQKIPVYIGEIDAGKLETNENLGSEFRHNYHVFKADKIFKDGETLKLAGIEFKVLSTPGHTDGSVCFIVGDVIFSGDTLFYESIGRSDFPTGDFNELKASVKKLYSFDGDYIIYPGHGQQTTLSHERINNMFVREND